MRVGAEVIGVSVRVHGGLLGSLLVSAALTVSSASQAQVIDLPLLPAVDLSGSLDIPTPLVPILEGLQLPASVVGSIDDLCGAALSSQCGAALDAVGVLVPTTQQAVANAAASITTQTNTQITEFALSGGLLPPTQSPALLQTLSPTLSSFGVSGISHTAHDGFQIEGPIGGRTLGFDSLDVGATLGFRLDASRSVGLPADFLTLGAFANYTNSDIDVASNATIRELGLSGIGNASLDTGSAGGYALLTNGKIYGLALGSGEFGTASVDDGPFKSPDFDTSGFASNLVAGAILPLGSLTKVDLRGGLNYLTANAENHTGFGGLRYSDGEIDQFSGVISARLFTSWNYGPTVVRPFVQGGVDYRFHYENEIRIDDQKVSFEEGRTTVFGRAGVDFDIGNRSQVYFAIRGDHNDDFDTIAGQAGLTIRLN